MYSPLGVAEGHAGEARSWRSQPGGNMAFRLANATKDGMINAFGPLCNSGSVKIYGPASGAATTQPATPETTIVSGTHGSLLVSIPFATTAFTTSSGGAGNIGLNGGAISATVSASGTASWARVFKTDGTTPVFDVDITVNGGGGSMTFDNISFITGGTATINTMSISQPM
jgi:hypothetical protein